MLRSSVFSARSYGPRYRAGPRSPGSEDQAWASSSRATRSHVAAARVTDASESALHTELKNQGFEGGGQWTPPSACDREGHFEVR